MTGPPNHVALVRFPGGELRSLDETELGQIDKLRAKPGCLIWLDITDPVDEDIGLLKDEFDVHPLAVEDLQLRHQRPKIDTYPGQHVIVTYEVRKADGNAQSKPVEGDDGSALGEIHLFVGAGYLVSVHWGPSPVVTDVRERFSKRKDALGTTVGGLLYAVLDEVVDGYFPLLDALSERIDELEDQIVAGNQGGSTLREVLSIKRELLQLRRVLAPQRDVANTLLRREVELIEDAILPYFQDLYDHLVRVLDQLDLYRDLVAATLEANLSVTSNNLNAVMKRLTAFTVVLMVPTLIAGIYGMNFHVMPELSWPLGYPIALVVMALTMTGLGIFFWRKDWF
jgi:magnesium transporter